MAIDPKHYVPIVKSRAGEIDALSELAGFRSHFTPVIELIPIPLKWIEGQDDPVPAKTIDKHVDSLVDAIKLAWDAGREFMVDGFHVEDEDVLDNDCEAIEEILNRLHGEGYAPIPVVGLERVEAYTQAVSEFVRRTNGDVCLRVTATDLGNSGEKIAAIVGAFMARYDFRAESTHLLMDYGPIPPALSAGLKLIVVAQAAGLAAIASWKSFIIAGSGFPLNLTDVAQYTIDEFIRSEWLIWLQARNSAAALGRSPTFGDYTVVHPELVIIDPRIMRISPKIKYTDDIRWIVAKGEATRRKKEKIKSPPHKDQYPKLAKMIMEHPAWRGESFSWGDQQIALAMTGKAKSDAQTWVTVGIVHHVVLCVRQISSLGET
jgi:hypothetical protein